MSVARILVVDDNAADVNLLRRALDAQKVKYHMDVLSNGEDALRFIRDKAAREKEPDPCVILLDLHLTHWDGLAVLEAIRQSPDLAHVNVVVLSGLASPKERKRIAALGAAYRQKPFQLADFMELGAAVLAICRDAMALAQSV
ncbi:MAG TPA: response regulator [Bryobacteraceae bacterium]|jgi:CheY-like chemotaxis protein|nr:response regulator [Bryobacteraceae bacterium]